KDFFEIRYTVVKATAMEIYGSTEAHEVLGSPMKCNNAKAITEIGAVIQVGIQCESLPMSRWRKIYSSTNGPTKPRMTIDTSREDSPAAGSTASRFAETLLSCPDMTSSKVVNSRVPSQTTGNSSTLTHHQVANQRSEQINGRHEMANMMMPVML